MSFVMSQEKQRKYRSLKKQWPLVNDRLLYLYVMYCDGQERRYPFPEYMDLTPEDARFIKQCNAKNRRKRGRNIQKYKRAMESGKWRANHQGFAFYNTGETADCQHRADALVQCKAGTVIPVLVVFGLSLDCAPTIDIGGARDNPDRLQLARQVKADPRMASVLSFIAQGEAAAKVQIPEDDFVEQFDRHRLALEFVQKHLQGDYFAGPIAGAFGRAFYLYDHEELEKICRSLVKNNDFPNEHLSAFAKQCLKEKSKRSSKTERANLYKKTSSLLYNHFNDRSESPSTNHKKDRLPLPKAFRSEP